MMEQPAPRRLGVSTCHGTVRPMHQPHHHDHADEHVTITMIHRPPPPHSPMGHSGESHSHSRTGCWRSLTERRTGRSPCCSLSGWLSSRRRGGRRTWPPSRHCIEHPDGTASPPEKRPGVGRQRKEEQANAWVGGGSEESATSWCHVGEEGSSLCCQLSDHPPSPRRQRHTGT